MPKVEHFRVQAAAIVKADASVQGNADANAAADVEKQARDIFGKDADTWLDAENIWLGRKTPRQAVNDNEEQAVKELLDAIRYGVFS